MIRERGVSRKNAAVSYQLSAVRRALGQKAANAEVLKQRRRQEGGVVE
jgi:hypothetical protein